jgi:general stress protein 26
MDTRTQQDVIKTLNEKIKGIKSAMLTTVSADGALHSRPMVTQDVECDGTLWFFTDADTPKAGDVARERQVCLTYIRPDDKLWVSISGTARLIHDQAMMQALWRPTLAAWFPQGLHDPHLALLEVTITNAEYWEGPNAVATALSALRGAITGQQKPLTEEKRLDLAPPG